MSLEQMDHNISEKKTQYAKYLNTKTQISPELQKGLIKMCSDIYAAI